MPHFFRCEKVPPFFVPLHGIEHEARERVDDRKQHPMVHAQKVRQRHCSHVACFVETLEQGVEYGEQQGPGADARHRDQRVHPARCESCHCRAGTVAADEIPEPEQRSPDQLGPEERGYDPDPAHVKDLQVRQQTEPRGRHEDRSEHCLGHGEIAQIKNTRELVGVPQSSPFEKETEEQAHDQGHDKVDAVC